MLFFFILSSGSKNFKKKFKGKGDDIKLKVKPKKFSKDFKGDNPLGRKRKANDTQVDDHRKETFKVKKWKSEEESQNGRKGHSKHEKSHKHFPKNNKESQDMTKKGKFGNGKAMKRKLSDGNRSKDFVKKKKSSGPGEHSNGNV